MCANPCPLPLLACCPYSPFCCITSTPTGQPVEGCDTRNRFCRPIPGNTRFVCQYNFRPEGALCPLNANPAAAIASLAESFLEELSTAEIQEMGLEAEPSAEDIDSEDSVQLASASEPQQNVNRRNNRPRNNKALPCGQCRNNVCVAAPKKWCKEARKRAANDAGNPPNII